MCSSHELLVFARTLSCPHRERALQLTRVCLPSGEDRAPQRGGRTKRSGVLFACPLASVLLVSQSTGVGSHTETYLGSRAQPAVYQKTSTRLPGTCHCGTPCVARPRDLEIARICQLAGRLIPTPCIGRCPPSQRREILALSMPSSCLSAGCLIQRCLGLAGCWSGRSGRAP